jgi:hypothetical protein
MVLSIRRRLPEFLPAEGDFSWPVQAFLMSLSLNKLERLLYENVVYWFLLFLNWRGNLINDTQKYFPHQSQFTKERVLPRRSSKSGKQRIKVMQSTMVGLGPCDLPIQKLWVNLISAGQN